MNVRIACRGGRLCPPLKSYEFAEDFRKKGGFCRAGRVARPYKHFHSLRVRENCLRLSEVFIREAEDRVIDGVLLAL